MSTNRTTGNANQATGQRTEHSGKGDGNKSAERKDKAEKQGQGDDGRAVLADINGDAKRHKK